MERTVIDEMILKESRVVDKESRRRAKAKKNKLLAKPEDIISTVDPMLLKPTISQGNLGGE